VRWSRELGSFRDPSGFIFTLDGGLYRQVNATFSEHYRRLLASGLYDELVRDRLIVPHEEVAVRLPDAPPAAAVLKPEYVPFISYPYEWCFSQLKAAALLTLELQRRALARGMVLRDASAYNVQFQGTHPIFIDTLSFGTYVEGTPWAAYRQFCQHFVAPLALMAYAHHSLGDLARSHISGVPLDLACSVLPLRCRFKPGLLMHLHVHGRAAASTPNARLPRAARSMTRTAMLGLLDSLERTVQNLVWKPAASLWSTYASHMNYSEAAQEHKRRIVSEMIDTVSAATPLRTVWDLGANTGTYSRLAAAKADHVISFDGDSAVVDYVFRQSREDRSGILPLVQDLTNPSPAIGWNHDERRSLLQRGPADLVLALALVHHLTISGNVPLEWVATFFRRSGRYLIIEFVPREDSQVQGMLALREEVVDYTPNAFERSFNAHFKILRSVVIPGTDRTMYLMEQR
jgi:hypothetical protein